MGFGMGFCCCTAATECERSYFTERFDSKAQMDPLWNFNTLLDIEGTDYNVDGVFEFLTNSPRRFIGSFRRVGPWHLSRLTPIYAVRGTSYRFSWESWIEPLASTTGRGETIWVEVLQSPIYGALGGVGAISNTLLVSHELFRTPDPSNAVMQVRVSLSDGLPPFAPITPTPGAEVTYEVPRSEWGGRRNVVVEWVPVSRVRVDEDGRYLYTYQYFDLTVTVDGTVVVSTLTGRLVEPKGSVVVDRPGNWDCDEYVRIRSGHYYSGGLDDLSDYVEREGVRYLDNFAYQNF